MVDANGFIKRNGIALPQIHLPQMPVIDKELKEQAYTYFQKFLQYLAYLPLILAAAPFAVLAAIVVANVGVIVLFPAAVWWGAFAYWFPAQAEQVLKFIKGTYAAIVAFLAAFPSSLLLLVLRIRETIRTFLWSNLTTTTKYDGDELAPFYPEVIDGTAEFFAGGGAPHTYEDIKKAVSDFSDAIIPEKLAHRIKAL